MIDVLLFLTCLPFWFGPSLSAPAFAERERASASLRSCYPWSLPYCYVERTYTADSERKDRAEAIIERAEPFAWDCLVWVLVAQESPRRYTGDLPWLPVSEYSRYGSEQGAKLAFRRLINHLRGKGFFAGGACGRAIHPAGRSFHCDSPFDMTEQPGPNFESEGWLTGLNDVRFLVRGLPCPSAWGVCDLHQNRSNRGEFLPVLDAATYPVPLRRKPFVEAPWTTDRIGRLESPPKQ